MPLLFAAFPGSEQIAAFAVKCLAVAGGFLAGYVIGGMGAWALDKWALAKKSPDVLKKTISFLCAVALALLIAFIVFGDGSGSGWLGGGGGPDGPGNNANNPDSGQKPDTNAPKPVDPKVQPKIDTLTLYNAGKNKSEMESFMVLGFGGRGHDLPPSYEVKYAGTETIDGVKTEKLELVPKSQKTRNVFNKIVLWIDPARGISVRQQLFTPSQDYRLAKYTNIKINQKISDDVFKVKTTSHTKTLTPQG